MSTKPLTSDKLSIKWLLWNYARPFWKWIVILVFITLTSNLLTAFQPVVLSGFMTVIMGNQNISSNAVNSNSVKINAAKPNDSMFNLNHIGPKFISLLQTGDPKNPWRTFFLLAAIYIAIAITSSIANYLAYLVALWVQINSTKLIQLDILQHLMSLNIGFFHGQKSGELMSRITQDALNTAKGLGPLVMSTLKWGILIIIYSTYLFSTSFLLSFGAIVLILMQFGLSQLLKKPVRRTVRTQFDRMADFSTTLQEAFTSIRVIKSFGSEKYEVNKIGKNIDGVVNSNFKNGLVQHFEEPARFILDSFAIMGIFFIAAFQLINGSLSLQGFVMFVYVGRLLIEPINKFSVNFVWVQALLASFERIKELFLTKPTINDGEIVKNDFRSSIILKNVSFSYGHEDVIRDFSLRIDKGNVIALVGSSGAGKSTLADLILRFYDPYLGDIFIDDINLKDIKQYGYRSLFGVVSQESLLFHDTVMNNIIYGREGVGAKEVYDAARTANAHDFIMELPKGYDTLVGDRGVRLSGGQRQRIAIARAIAAKPSILILDEATSSLDSESEKQVQTAIDHVLENSTAIVIAHRLSTVLHADKIVVMNKGKIESVGKHSELLDKSPVYNNLYSIQFNKASRQGEN